MIIISEQSFVILGEDLQTPKKVKQGVVKFTTPLIGKVSGWVTFEDELGAEITNGLVTEYDQSYFTGEKVDILLTLHTEFKAALETLNPSLTFTIEI
jgi:hypothetical protein